jgi:hypothetical protein
LLVICGDFNSKRKPVSNMNDVTGEGDTWKRTISGSEVKSRTDWVLINHKLEHET